MPHDVRRRRGNPLAWVLVVLLVGAPVWLATLAAARAPVPATVTQRTESGGAVFQTRCAACHGTAGEGVPGSDAIAGPPLRRADIRFVDMTLRTGRMPLRHAELGVTGQRLTDDEREALLEWARVELDLTGEIPEVDSGDPQNGRRLYAQNCAACHGVAAGGGVAGGGTEVPALDDVDRTAVVEAIRVGPFEMPAFSERVLSERDAEDLAAYVDEVLGEGSPAPLGMKDVGPVRASLFTVLAMALVLALVVVVGRIRRR